MDPRHLIRMQIELEYQLDSVGRLVPFTGSEEQARFILYCHVQGYERFFRFDLPERQYTRLMELEPGKPHSTVTIQPTCPPRRWRVAWASKPR
jgi:hypothetical protein